MLLYHTALLYITVHFIALHYISSYCMCYIKMSPYTLPYKIAFVSLIKFEVGNRGYKNLNTSSSCSPTNLKTVSYANGTRVL